MRIHTTKDGTRIKLCDMTDSHLEATIRLLERKAAEGITICSGGGSCPDEFWYEEERLYGKAALKHMGYFNYVKERDRRISSATGERPETRSDDRTQIVVRLHRSYWHDNDGAYQRTSLRYLKRHTKGFNFFDEDCSMVGTEDVIPKIVNLAKCEDGVYLLVMCNAHRDWETGHVEDWDYQLLPFSPNAQISGGTPSAGPAGYRNDGAEK
jgi:hypothetical protein